MFAARRLSVRVARRRVTTEATSWRDRLLQRETHLSPIFYLSSRDLRLSFTLFLLVGEHSGASMDAVSRTCCRRLNHCNCAHALARTPGAFFFFSFLIYIVF